MDRITEGSWTGSEGDRRPQGKCDPPVRPANKQPLYSVPAGTPCRVARVGNLRWRDHVTREPLGFGGHEGYKARHYTFRHRGWLLIVHRRHVVHAADWKPAG